MSSDDIAISVRNLSKSYRLFGHPGDRIKQFFSLGIKKYHRDFSALRDVSFDIKRGETVGIIGRNGSGKSTLLQLICGILKPTSGTVKVNGRVAALLELGAGFNPEFTGRENVYFQGAVMGLSKSDMDNCLSDIAAFADIGEFIDQPVRIYSSGMYVRLAFAAAIYVRPDILVVDEALSVGDAQFQAKCFAKIREFRDTGVTILLVTHNLDLVAAHCEHAILLDQGALIKIGSTKTAIDNYRRLLTTQPPVIAKKRAEDGVISPALWAPFFQTNPSEVRYGSRDAEIIEAGIFTSNDSATQVIPYGDVCLIKIRALKKCECFPPFISYVIKDLKGVPLFGTTTLIEGVHIESLGFGKVLRVVFRLTMFLNPGHYLLSVGVQAFGHDGNPVAYDHRSDYLPFEVVGKPRYGIFAPLTNVSLEMDL